MVNRQELLDALQAVKPGLAGKEVIEQTASFVFSPDLVTTYNDEIAVSHPVAGVAFTGAVPGTELYTLLSKIKDETISFESNGQELAIAGKRIQATVRLNDKITLPLEAIKPEHYRKVPENFMKAVEFCLPSTSKDLSDSLLSCIHINKDVVESCDNFRMSRYKIGRGRDEALLPASAIKELLKYEITEVSFVEGWAHFLTKSNCQFSCRTFAGEYVDLSPFLETADASSIIFPADMDGILDRAATALLSSSEQEQYVRIIIRGGTITVMGEGDVIWTTETARLRTEIDGEVTFMINPEFLRQILKNNNEAFLVTEGTRRIKFVGENYEHVMSLK